MAKLKAVLKKTLIKLDLGCGPNPKEGFIGVDSIAFNDKVKQFDLGSSEWPWADNSVEESYCSHFLEHLTNLDDKWERVNFFNELYRVTIAGGKCHLVIPHWCSNRYYGDPTHKEPFSEMGFYYLDPNWRVGNAPHADIKNNPNGYSCHWNCTWGYAMHESLHARNSEYQQFAIQFYKEACQDIICTMVANKD